LDIVTTRHVWGELESDQRKVLQQWIESQNLSVIEVEGDLDSLRDNNQLSVGLSIADLSVWNVCYEAGAILLTSDGTLRKMAKENKIKTHGLLWIFDQIMKNKILTVEVASKKLQYVFNNNEYYKADVKLFDAYEAMKAGWKDQSE
jgi:hypothetical protein